MFDWLINQAKNLLSNIFGGGSKPAPKKQPVQPAKPAAPAKPAPKPSPVNNWLGSAVNTVKNWIQPPQNNALLAQQAAQRAAAEAARKKVQATVNNWTSTFTTWLKPKAQAPQKWGNNKIMLRPDYLDKPFKPIAPLQPVPIAPSPVWKDKSGVWHGNQSDIKAYEKDVDRYNTQWKEYVDKRFQYSNDLFTFNQKTAELAQNKSKSEEALKLHAAQIKDNNANLWGKIGNFFTGGETQKARDDIKNTIEANNKKLAGDTDKAAKALEEENKKFLTKLQKKLEAGDVNGFNEEFDKYDAYVTKSQNDLMNNAYKEFGKQQAQQEFLNKTKTEGLIGKTRDLGTWGLGVALDVLDVPRRIVNTGWNMIDSTRTRTYYDGTVKTDKIKDLGQAWSESYNQNVISQHQREKYDPKKAREKFSSDYQDYKAGGWKSFNQTNQIRNDMKIPAGLSEEEYYKRAWEVDQEKQIAQSGIQDFFADPTLIGGFMKQPLKEGAKKLGLNMLWKKTAGTAIKKIGTGVQKITKNPKIAGKLIGWRVGKVGQAIDWLKKPSTATAKGRWEHDPRVIKALTGRELAQNELDEIAKVRFNKTFNKTLQLLPTKIRDVTGKLVRVEGVDVLKDKLTKMTKTQARAFNHYVQPMYDNKGKLISGAYSWSGQGKYYKMLSRKDKAIVHNLATAYKAVTDKLYSLDRLTSKRGFKKVPESIRTYHGGFFEGAPQQWERPLAPYAKKQGYVAKSFKPKTWGEKLASMRDWRPKMFRVGDKVTTAKPVQKWNMIGRKDPHFTQHKVLKFTNQSGREIAGSLDERILASRREYAKTIPENYLMKTQGKRLQGFVQNPNQRWVTKSGLESRFNPEIKISTGIKGYEDDLAHLAASREFQKGGWEKVMEVAGFPKKVWTQSVTRFRPAWYLNNMAWNVPASTFAGGKGTGKTYGKILSEIMKEKTLVPKLLQELPKEVTNVSARFGTLGTKIENISRAAAYITMRDAGVPKAEALKRLNDWLFDYAKTSNWERPLRTVMPFWSFHKGLAMIAVKAPLKYPKSAFIIASFKREFMEKPLAGIPDEAITWRDPITGEEVKMNKRDLYHGKMKIPFTENTWVNSPFFPFGDSKISLHPVLDLFEEHKSGMDVWGRDVTDKEFWRKAVARIPQLEIVARAYEALDQKMDPEKFIQRWVSENGSTKWAQGFDPSSPNYKPELDNSKRFWDNARSFFGLPNTYTYDYESNSLKTRMAEFQREYFSKNWESLDWGERDKQQKDLAKKYDLTLDQVYKNWARFDTPMTTHLKEQKQEAREISSKFWKEYFTKDKGQQYIKDVQEGKKSERAAFLREYLVKSLATGAFANNRFLIGQNTIKKTLMSLAQDVAYSKVKTARFNSYQMSKKPENKGKFIWRGQVISVPPSQKAIVVRKAVTTGDWTEYRRLYGSEKSKIVAEAIRTGDWSEYREKYGSKYTEAEIAEFKFWAEYAKADPAERRKMLKEHPEYNKRKDWTRAQWDTWENDKKAKERAGLDKIAGDKVQANRAFNKSRADRAWGIRYRPVSTAKWKQ